MPEPTTLFVHAHPDDEAIFSAATLRRLADAGRRAVLVTCTNGRLGFDPGQRPGNHPDHDRDLTERVRAGELAASARLCGVDRLITLGFNDSGLPGWPRRDPTFTDAPIEVVARTLAAIIDEVGATTVVTYDPTGYYGHPDHVHAHQVARRAVDLAPSVDRLYYPIAGPGQLERFRDRARARGVRLPGWVTAEGAGGPALPVDRTVDGRAVAGTKRAALAAHASQIDNADLVTLDEELFALLFGWEFYSLGWARPDAASTDPLGDLS